MAYTSSTCSLVHLVSFFLNLHAILQFWIIGKCFSGSKFSSPWSACSNKVMINIVDGLLNFIKDCLDAEVIRDKVLFIPLTSWTCVTFDDLSSKSLISDANLFSVESRFDLEVDMIWNHYFDCRISYIITNNKYK